MGEHEIKGESSFLNQSMVSSISGSVLSQQYLAKVISKPEIEPNQSRFQQSFEDIRRVREKYYKLYLENSDKIDSFLKKLRGNTLTLENSKDNSKVKVGSNLKLFNDLYSKINLPKGFENDYESWVESEFPDIFLDN